MGRPSMWIRLDQLPGVAAAGSAWLRLALACVKERFCARAATRSNRELYAENFAGFEAGDSPTYPGDRQPMNKHIPTTTQLRIIARLQDRFRFARSIIRLSEF